MPAYDFRCKTCEHKFTVRVSISERDTVRCPQCGSSVLQQIFTPVGVTVKGNNPGCSFADSGNGCGAGGCGCAC